MQTHPLRMRVVTRIMVDSCQIRCATEHTRSLPCGGYCLITPRIHSADTRSGTGTGDGTGTRDAAADGEHGREKGIVSVSDSSLLVQGLILAMRLRSAVEPALVTIAQFVNEVRMLGESKKLKLAQNYYSHYSAHSEDEPRKPCLSNQLYR